MAEDEIARWLARIDRRLSMIEADMRLVRECVQGHGERLALLESHRLTPEPGDMPEGTWDE